MLKTVYIDGIFDLFHRGHLECIKKCKLYGNKIVVGIISDIDATEYKRQPIINEVDRCEIIKNLKDVDSIIFPAPLIVNEKFIEENNIDMIVHAFSSDQDFEKQKDFFKIPIQLNKFTKIDYYDKISTTDIINKIKINY
tara:strand:+ start:125 stop:541 length:417 start_codon:yes stop_codon:yes gene_type:complete